MSQEIENQQITSLKYTVVLPRLRQNERNRAFSMVVAGTSEKELQVCFVALIVLVHNLVRRYNKAGNTIDAP